MTPQIRSFSTKIFNVSWWNVNQYTKICSNRFCQWSTVGCLIYLQTFRDTVPWIKLKGFILVRNKAITKWAVFKKKLNVRNLMCPVQKLGHKLGEATMFQVIHWGISHFINSKNILTVLRSWTTTTLRTLIFYFWSNIELTWPECSFRPQMIKSLIIKKKSENKFLDLFYDHSKWG